ncbi:hypothetical protein [Halanaeroarchaeum sulfurireducens]|uniref:hypothetical protein n=1 Tax=Halanaeroarchaeum sulfurireducens TaxID=1604004 RepID=UPI0006785533|nr:hypothetical protein [Halanaeroarchaeum sulfurireducens]
MSTQPVSGRVDEETAAALDDVLPETMSRSEAVARAIEQFVAKADPGALAEDDLVDIPDVARRGYEELLELTNGGGRIDKLAADPALAEATGKGKSKPSKENTAGRRRSPVEVAVLNPLVEAGLVGVIQGNDYVAYHVRPKGGCPPMTDRIDDGTSVCTLGIPAHVPTRVHGTSTETEDRPVPPHVSDGDSDD